MIIVAPAGDIEKFYTAVDAGGDEVYMGLQGFGARKSAKNFTVTEYCASIDYAHERGSRVLLTLNTIMMDNEIPALYLTLKKLYEEGLDAIIVQDLGMFKFIRDNFPKIEIHGSTQMTVSNHVEANYLKELGFKRVVLSRELSFEDIKKIRENTDIELEVFVSGSLCVSYSGKCYMSSFIGSRSGNRGMCAQPCRKNYVSSENEKGYLISPNDQLMGAKEITLLKEIGVDSIKIEGRMKDSNYVYELTNYYRELITGIDRESRIEELFNRGYSKGYFYNDATQIINKNYSSNLGQKVGDFSGKEVLLCEELRFGDGIIFVSKTFEKLGGMYINRLEIKEGRSIEKTPVRQKNEVILMKDAPVGSRYLYRTYSKDTIDSISNEKKIVEKNIEITCEFKGQIGEFPTLTFSYINLYGDLIEESIVGEKLVEEASKKALEPEEILNKISELGETTFALNKEKSKVTLDGSVFIPISIIKNMKRDCAEELIEKILDGYKRKVETEMIFLEEEENSSELDTQKEILLSAIVKTNEQEVKVRELGISKVYYSGVSIVKEGNIGKVENSGNLAYSFLDLVKTPNENLTTHWTLNITNKYAMDILAKNSKIETVMLSPELSFERIKNIGETKLKKGLLIYSKAKIMHIEAGILADKTLLNNDMGDRFVVERNELGNTEIYLTKALDITDRMKEIRELNVDEAVLEFRDENLVEIENIIKGIQEKKDPEKENAGYNYWKGVF